MLMKVEKHPDDLVPTNIAVTDFSEDGKPEIVKADLNLNVEQLHVDFRMYNLKLKPLTVDRTLNSYNCEGYYLSSEGYSQIFIAEDDMSKIAFHCPGALGTYEWVVMPFGLKNAGATYQRAMNAIFHEFIGKFMEVYIDDVMVKSISMNQHIDHLRKAFVTMRKKLKCYVVAKSVKVVAQTDLIKYMLSFPMLRGRLGKWMLALTEFDLQYVPARAVKGQVIADFLVDNSNNLNDQGAHVIDIEVDYWKLYFDGSKHKDGAGVGIFIISPEGIPSEFLFELKYPCSNNVAEIGPETLRKLASIHQILVPANEREVLCIDEWEDNDWRKPVAEYLKNPSIPADRKIKLQAINFVLMADELYKKGIDGSLSRCLGQDYQNIALGEVHKGICGAHQAGKKMKWVLYRTHVYWPTMIKDCIEYAKACQECQKHGSIQQIPASELPFDYKTMAI
ncbi:uncharacterized protein [Arachis hypogaea]|uniref:uncharacterized protein n=1 Tax=Arachis hypogaea TaxID=3818 RepID=UPI003B212F67